MDEKIVLGMVRPYLKRNQFTFSEFFQIFSMLSFQEQLAVFEILNKNRIEVVEKKSVGQPDEDDIKSGSKDFEILYDDDLFSDEDDEESIDAGFYQTDYLINRKNIYLSNKSLIRLIQEGDLQAVQDLCVKNKRLVDKYANIYHRVFGSVIDFEDLEQAGMMGMIIAAEKFDLELGTEFSTYAVWWIRQSITREIMNTGYTIRIPVHKMEQIFRVIRADSKHAEESDYYKRLELIGLDIGMQTEDVEECLRLYYQFLRTTSLDLPIGEEQDTLLVDIIPKENEITTEEEVSHTILKESLSEVLSTLTQREQKVIRLRFGLDDGRPRTLEEVGKEFNVTRERIRQIEAKALRKLRHPSRSRKLKDYLD